MKQFSQMNIKLEESGFVGEKIKMEKVLNKKIIVHGHEIRESKYKEKGNGQCLYLQIEFSNEKRVLFTGSTKLMEMIRKVGKEDFPFETIIEKENDCLKFT